MANDEFRNAKTSVWWDLEKCPVAFGVDPHSIARNIRSALSKCDYKGSVSITAFGDTRALSPTIQRALSSTGIALHHVPSGVKDASDNSILVDMLFWAVDNPAPANYLLISGDRDFANALHQLSMRRYNILLAYPTVDVPSSLLSAAKAIWLWRSLAMGEQLMPTIKDVKQFDKIFDYNIMSNGTYKIPSELNVDLPKPMLKESFSNDFNRFSGVHMKNRSGILSDFDQERGQYMYDSCNERSKTVTGLTNGERHYGNKTYFPETNVLLGTSSMGQMFSSSIETRISSPPDSDGARSKQHSQHHAKNKLDSFKDTKPTFSNTRANPNPSAKACPPPLKTGFAPGANNVPAKLRNHNKMKPKQPSQVRPPFIPNIIRSSSPSLKNSFPSQTNPNFTTQNHPPSSSISADLRGDISAFDKMSISSDLQQSSNIKPSICVPISQLLPSEKKPQYPTSFKSNIVTQTESYTDAIHVSTSKLPLPQHSGTDISHRVHMRIISLAMETLKQNMIAPIEQNLEDCIKYGEMHIPNFNLREILDRAVEQKDIVVMKTGESFKVYLPRKSDIWQYVDPLSMHDGYPKELWDELYKYLSSHEGYEAMMQSQSRYDAAQKLKSSCLKTLLLGQIIHMLHLAIKTGSLHF
ncbi:hypothetical protein SUGI_0270530 [Cryptomeria japonica]|nr:hypothetical protein SUGI_0270530 [Cryptomeria japonica]